MAPCLAHRIGNLAKSFWAVRISTSSIPLVGSGDLENPLAQKDELRPGLCLDTPTVQLRGKPTDSATSYLPLTQFYLACDSLLVYGTAIPLGLPTYLLLITAHLYTTILSLGCWFRI